jgi:hypothetical protein
MAERPKFWISDAYGIGPNLSAVATFNGFGVYTGWTLLRSIYTIEFKQLAYQGFGDDPPNFQPIILGLYCSVDGLTSPESLPVQNGDASWLHWGLVPFTLTNWDRVYSQPSINVCRYTFEAVVEIDTPAQRKMTNLEGGRSWINWDSMIERDPSSPVYSYPLRELVSNYSGRQLWEAPPLFTQEDADRSPIRMERALPGEA